MRIYLSGPLRGDDAMLYRSDVSWRFRVAKSLRDMGHEGVMPADLQNLSIRKASSFGHVGNLYSMLEKPDLGEARERIRKNFILPDIEIISKADAILANLCGTYTPGTISECWEAYRTSKPVYVIWDRPILEIRPWMVGLSTEIFSSIEEFIKWLRTLG